MMKIVLATNNVGKIQEFRELLKLLPVEIIPQSDFGINEIEETGLTFVENALLKARHATRLTGLPALADDSGLAVAMLNGAPGIYSARYAGEKSKDCKNIEKLLSELEYVPDEKRHAHFYCVLAFMLHPMDPAPLICEGKWEGVITHSPQGENGFGYDPVFYVPEQHKTAAELDIAIKNTISHRGIALQLFLTSFPEKIHENSFIR